MLLRQHQIDPIACIAVHIRPWYVQYAGTTEGGETVGGSSGSGEFSPARRSAEMITDGRTYANGKVLIKSVGEHLLPTAQRWGLGRPSSLVPAPGAGNCHIDLFCHLTPGQTLITKLENLLRGGGMSGRT
jgi:hypothetical protein